MEHPKAAVTQLVHHTKGPVFAADGDDVRIIWVHDSSIFQASSLHTCVRYDHASRQFLRVQSGRAVIHLELTKHSSDGVLKLSFCMMQRDRGF